MSRNDRAEWSRNVAGTQASVDGYRPHPIESCYHLEDGTQHQ